MLRKLRSAVSRGISRHLTAWLICACKQAPARLMPAYPLASFYARIFVLVSFDLAALRASDEEDNHQSICRRGATAHLGTPCFLNMFQIRFWLQRSTLRRKPRTAPNKPRSGVGKQPRSPHTNRRQISRETICCIAESCAEIEKQKRTKASVSGIVVATS